MKNGGQLYLTLNINNKVRFLLDTGASFNVMSEKNIQEHKSIGINKTISQKVGYQNQTARPILEMLAIGNTLYL